MIQGSLKAEADSGLIGRTLCLDFANTAEWRASENPKEKLKTVNDFIRWAVRAGIVSGNAARRIILKAQKDPDGSTKVLSRARELREGIYRVFSALAAGKPVPKKDMEVLNRNLSKTMSHSRLHQTESGFIWTGGESRAELERVLDPIVRSAAELLLSENWKRVKVCADDRGCGYLFLDQSRNRSRRWCDMKDCGNRAKAKRFYSRKKREAALIKASRRA